MERELKTKVIIITGGAQGIGYTIGDHFLQHGAKCIVLLDIIETTGVQAAANLNKKYGDGKAVFMKCDVTKDLEEVSNEILQKFEVDVLVNNAGIVDEASPRRTLGVNAIAVSEWGMKFWEYMRKDKGGRGGTIFNVASIYGFRCEPWAIQYISSKHAIMGFTKSLGHHYNYDKTGVRVVAICPGYTQTSMITGLSHFDIHDELFKLKIATSYFQPVEVVGQAAVDIFVTADSGTTWVVEDGKPIQPAPSSSG